MLLRIDRNSGRRAALAVLALGCAVAAGAGDRADPALVRELAAIERTLPGRYAGSLATAARPDREGTLYHVIERVALPDYGELVFRHLLSLKGFDDPRPFQQKFYRFDLSPERTHNRMRSVVLMRAPRWQPGETLPREGLIEFPEECAIRWQTDERGLVARVRRGDCVYDSAALGGPIVPDMTYIATPDSFALKDQLFRPDGSQVTPGGGLVVAPRVRGD